jgi:hypothetical protein
MNSKNNNGQSNVISFDKNAVITVMGSVTSSSVANQAKTAAKSIN